jgi:hypothetical protein
MYLYGTVIGMSYVTDALKHGVVKERSYGLSVTSISAIRGGGLKKGEGMVTVNTYIPISLRVTDDARRFYDLGPGSYHVVFGQGLNKLAKDYTALIEPNNSCHALGVNLIPKRILEFNSSGNLSAVLVVPSGMNVTIEADAILADLIIKYEKTMEEM